MMILQQPQPSFQWVRVPSAVRSRDGRSLSFFFAQDTALSFLQ